MMTTAEVASGPQEAASLAPPGAWGIYTVMMTAEVAAGPQQAASMTPPGALGVLRNRCHQTG